MSTWVCIKSILKVEEQAKLLLLSNRITKQFQSSLEDHIKKDTGGAYEVVLRGCFMLQGATRLCACTNLNLFSDLSLLSYEYDSPSNNE